MRYFLLILAVVALVGCGKEKQQPVMGPASSKVTASDLAEAKAKDEAKAAAEAKEQSTIVEIADPIIENAILKELKMSGGSLFNKSDAVPKGELTKADLEKVTFLYLGDNQLTDVPKGLEKLTQLDGLWLNKNKLTDVKGLEKLTQLKELRLDDNQLTDVPKGLEKLTRLDGLWLKNSRREVYLRYDTTGYPPNGCRCIYTPRFFTG